jgi:hypothetical protein
MVSAAAALFPDRPDWDGSEGPRPRLTIGPAMLALSWPDLARRERSHERQADHEAHRIGMLASWPGRKDAQCRRITSWSRKSRARMMRRYCELDWTPLTSAAEAGRMLATITLTYPGDWVTVVPDAETFQDHVQAFYKRWERAWGEPLICAWKKEWQHRGAPHWAAKCSPPMGVAGAHRDGSQRPAVGDGLYFPQWLSAVWTDVVDHPDPEQRRRHLGAGTRVDWDARGTDPKRVAVYFLKHGQFSAKEYQNQPPAEWIESGKGTGRMWGYKGMRPATVQVEVEPWLADQLGRQLRRWSRAQKVTHDRRVPRYRGGRARPAYPEVTGLAGAQLLDAHRKKRRRVRRRTAYLGHGAAGFVCVNDGPGFASQLAQMIRQE